jgi:SAM-dependent methyltransferase
MPLSKGFLNKVSIRTVAIVGLCVVSGGGLVFAATPFGRDLLFHAMPLRWTGEATRIAAALRIHEGSAVADVGAGGGALIEELARIAGPSGRAFATERTPEQRQALAVRARNAGLNVLVVEAGEHVTNLPDACCDAVTMRMVMHHVADRQALANDLRRAVRSGGRVGIIDFAPGALPHLAADHGVDPAPIIQAFTTAGFTTEQRDLDWGGRTYLLVFRRP